MLFTKDTLNGQGIKNLEPKILGEEKESSSIWTLEFDGSCSSSRSSAGVVLIPPEGELEPMAFKLEFVNINNIIEYKALLLGVIATKEKGVKILKARGDVELIVRQIKGQYSIRNHKLKNYRNRVWDEEEGLDAFSIEVVPREMNTKANSLAVFTSLLLPIPKFKDKKYQVEIVYQASISNNIEYWQVFEDVKSLQLFLENYKATCEHSSKEDNHGDLKHEQREDQTDEVQL